MTSNPPPFPPGSSVVAYIRDSGGARQELSTIQQEQVIRAWADDAAITVARYFVDAARSGASVVKREAFLEMISWLEAGQDVAAVVVWTLSRFSRDYNDAQLYLARIRAAGYQVYSLEENVPPGSVGRIVESLHLLMAEAYRVELASNVKRGMLFVIKRFKAFPLPYVPIGYKKVPIDAGEHRDGTARKLHALELDPVYAPLVKKAFQMKATGATIKEIREELRLYDNLDSYSRLWRNKIYIGVFEWGGEVFEDFCPPIIDRATWGAVQELNAANTEKRIGFYHPRRVASSSLLSGLVFCKACGTVMRAQGSNRFTGEKHEYWQYYRCMAEHRNEGGCKATMIPAAKLEAEVMQAIKSTLLDPALLKAAYKRYTDTYGDRARQERAKLDALQEELAKTERRAKNIAIAVADGGHSKMLLEQLAEEEEKREVLLERLRALQDAQDAGVALFQELDAAGLEALGAAVWERIEQGDYRTRQKLIRAIVERIDVVRLPSKKTVCLLDGDITINPAFGALALQE